MALDKVLDAIQESKRETKAAFDAKVEEIKSEYASKIEGLQSDIRELKAKGGRFKSNPNTMENTFVSEFTKTLLENKDAIKKYAERPNEHGVQMEMKAVGDMTFGNNFSSANASITQVAPGIIGAPSRFTHIRDFITSTPLTTANYAYLKETGTQGAPAMVLEAGNKPQVDFELSEVSLPSQTLAAWLVVSNQMLEDVPALASFISRRLLERLLVVEDSQLLSGNGTPPNLSGIHNTGNFTAAASTDHYNVEQLVAAIAQLESYSRRASGIIVNPSDFYDLGLHKATGSGDYTLPPYAQITPGGDMTIAGVPIVRTLQQAVGTFTVGDFVNGTEILYRHTPEIRIFTDATLAKVNKTLIRIEERLLLAVYGSDYIVKGSFFVPDGSI